MKLPPEYIDCTHCKDGLHPNQDGGLTRLCPHCGGTKKMRNSAYEEAVEDSIDKEFAKEFGELCQKYNRHIGINMYEMLCLYRGLGDTSLYMPAERRKAYEEEMERERQRAVEREIQHRKVREEYVRNGGILDEHGNIPVPKDYCQVIDVRRV